MNDNPVIFQSFEWDIPADRRHYQRLVRVLPILHSVGITALWLPPACKAGTPTGNGYDIYDLYDLGEFDQKGSRATKWGPKEDLMALIQKAKELNLHLYFDAVLNHRCGGDGKTFVSVVEVDPEDRTKALTRPKQIESWLQFGFDGRGGQYSTARYDWRQFNATDWDDRGRKHAIFKIVDGGKEWAKDVSSEWGNGDYLLLNNLDYTSEELRDDVNHWGIWVTEHMGLSGFRLDAIQHFSHVFSNNWIKYVQEHTSQPMFFVGEYWNGDVDILMDWLKNSPADLYLYDAPLLYNLARTSWSKAPDLRTIFEKTLVDIKPNNAVTLVMNHDTQRGQVMDAPIAPKFTSLAYALVLLREAGYPCVFYGDLYGVSPPHASLPTCGGKLADLILARKLYAYGEQQDYFASRFCIGWVRKGLVGSNGHRTAGMAVVMSWVPDAQSLASEQSSSSGPRWIRRLAGMTGMRHGQTKPWSPKQLQRRMNVGIQHSGETWSDLLGESREWVTIDREGFGTFPCQKNSVAIFVSERAEGRDRFPTNFQADIYSR